MEQEFLPMRAQFTIPNLIPFYYEPFAHEIASR